MVIFFNFPWRGRAIRQDVPFEGQRTNWPGWAGHGGRGGQWPPDEPVVQETVRTKRSFSRGNK